MEMKKRLTLELRNKEPGEVSPRGCRWGARVGAPVCSPPTQSHRGPIAPSLCAPLPSPRAPGRHGWRGAREARPRGAACLPACLPGRCELPTFAGGVLPFGGALSLYPPSPFPSEAPPFPAVLPFPPCRCAFTHCLGRWEGDVWPAWGTPPSRPRHRMGSRAESSPLLPVWGALRTLWGASDTASPPILPSPRLETSWRPLHALLSLGEQR